MKPYDSKAQFNQLFKSQHFLRVDSTHPLELFLGVDKKGRKALRFLGDFTPSKLTGTKAIEIKQFTLENRNCIQFSLLNPEVADPFYKFVDDLVDASRNLENLPSGYGFVISRYNRWKKMFLPSKGVLSEKEIMGFLGELYFLFSFLLPKYGEEMAVNSWSAPDPTLKDFSIGDTWYEVKTTGPESQIIRIHSLQQLAFDRPGKLILIRLEKMASTFSGLTLNAMIQSIMSKIISPEVLDEFQAKIARRGYAFSEKYNEYVYEVKEMVGFLVDDRFPKLKIDNMDGAIINAEYDLLIDKLKNYIDELK